jgi:hypothetical protein
MDKIIILLDGFTKSEAETALKEYSRAGYDAPAVTLAPVTDTLAEMTTSEALAMLESGSWPGGAVRTGVDRGALMRVPGKAEAVALMRAFKSVLPADHDSAFAMITETGLKWTVAEYLTHIRKEHEFMKEADPEADPDMKPV